MLTERDRYFGGCAAYLVEVAAQFLVLGGESLDAALGDAVLVQGGLQLALDVVVVRLQFRQLSGTGRKSENPAKRAGRWDGMCVGFGLTQ